MFHTSPLSRIALAQSLVVFIGVMTTCGMLKLNHYDPQSGTRWNPVAVAIREAGFLLLAIPVGWTVLCLVLESRDTSRWNRTWTIVSGLAIIAGLVSFLWWTTATPTFYQKLPLQEL